MSPSTATLSGRARNTAASSEQSGSYWQTNIDPQLLSDVDQQQFDCSGNEEASVRQNSSSLREMLANRASADGDIAQDLATLEALLLGISAYILQNVEATTEMEEDDVQYRSDALAASSSEDYVANMIRPSVESRDCSSRESKPKQRRAKTVRISSPGQNPRKLWMKRKRQDSVVAESTEKLGVKMEDHEELTSEEPQTKQDVDHEKMRWTFFHARVE